MTNQTPKAPSKVRSNIYEVLDGERDYQDETHPSSPAPTLQDFAILLTEYTGKLALPTGGNPLKRLREIAAIAVHAMELHGVQPRENHVPASAGITGVLKVAMKSDTTAPK